jgi:hypothetical protein
MDTAAIRCSAALLVLGYVTAVCAPLRPSLYHVTIVALLAALALFAMEWAVDRIKARDRARRAPRLTVWMPRHAGNF